MLVFTKAGACVGQVFFPPLSVSYTQLPYISSTTLVRYLLLIESLGEDTDFRPIPDTWNTKMNTISQHLRQRISFPDRYRDDPSSARPGIARPPIRSSRIFTGALQAMLGNTWPSHMACPAPDSLGQSFKTPSTLLLVM